MLYSVITVILGLAVGFFVVFMYRKGFRDGMGVQQNGVLPELIPPKPEKPVDSGLMRDTELDEAVFKYV